MSPVATAPQRPGRCSLSNSPHSSGKALMSSPTSDLVFRQTVLARDGGRRGEAEVHAARGDLDKLGDVLQGTAGS